jgi:hypothetical protein
VIAKGQKILHEKYPALANWIVPMLATMIFRQSAVGFISSAGAPTSAIAARYALAPACPIEE